MESLHSSMSWDSFAECVLQMKAMSDELHDEWTLHGKSEHENRAYLSKKLYRNFGKIVPNSDLGSLEESNVDDGNGDDESFKVESILTIEYHIVYSTSYSCPVLCFNAWKTDGSLLSLEECWQNLGISNFENKYNTLTQMDHPVLMRPFLTLHPCKTAELIGTSFEKSKNPVVSWLSTVGPAVGLNILTDYAKLTF